MGPGRFGVHAEFPHLVSGCYLPDSVGFSETKKNAIDSIVGLIADEYQRGLKTSLRKYGRFCKDGYGYSVYKKQIRDFV